MVPPSSGEWGEGGGGGKWSEAGLNEHQTTGDNALKANVGETIRIFFGVGGPNITSSFHIIGEVFDRCYPEGAAEVHTHVQTTLVPAGGATMVELELEVPGTYVMVDHSLGRVTKGAAGQIVVEGEENPDVFSHDQRNFGAQQVRTCLDNTTHLSEHWVQAMVLRDQKSWSGRSAIERLFWTIDNSIELVARSTDWVARD